MSLYIEHIDLLLFQKLRIIKKLRIIIIQLIDAAPILVQITLHNSS